MDYRQLGRTALKASELCLGTIASTLTMPSTRSLSPEQVARLSASTAPRSIYPEWMVGRQNEGRR